MLSRLSLGLLAAAGLAFVPRQVVPAAATAAARSDVVELVAASSDGVADLVAARMRAGFLIDQLTIEGGTYLGRFGLADLDSDLSAALREAGPGVPLRVTRAGKLLVGQIVARGLPAILGEETYAQGAGRVVSILSRGPTNYELLSVETPGDGEDLRAVCREKRAFIAREVDDAKAGASRVTEATPLGDAVKAYGRLTSALSLMGDFEGAIGALQTLSQRLPPLAAVGTLDPRWLTLQQLLGILELRRGEQDNCVLHHNREMCLFPLSARARHVTGDGARQAVSHFSAYLDRDPGNLEVQWLLNVAAMTLGTYPDAVPERFRIPPETLRSKEDLGRFWDVAGPAGLARSDNAGGVVTDDFDNDGQLDVAISSRDPCEPLRLFRNLGDGTFSDITSKAGLSEQLGGLNITQTDYNNDGRIDLFVMRGGWETAIRNSLLRNNGDGTFTDVTAAAGLAGTTHRTHSVAWADFDSDGLLDVFVGHELSWSQLFRNRGDGTFEDVTARAGVRFRSLTKGVVWGDIDNDGLPDLYVSNFGDRNLLFHNLGGGRFEEVGRERGVSEPDFSFTTWFWDYDNDGFQDLFVATFLQTVDEVAREYLGQPPMGETLRVYHNRGDGSFEDVTRTLGLARMIPTMGANFGDLDNDGYLDFYLATGAPSYGMLVPNRMFHNKEGHSFVDVTESTGTGHLQKGHGVAFADLDSDGDEDVFANIGGAFPGDKYARALFENPGHGNDWLTLHLVGTRTNRAAIGTRIRVVLDEGGRETQRVRWVTSGGSFGSSPLAQHIGLGRGARVKRVELDWPVGHTRQVVEGVPVNRIVKIVEGKPGFRVLARKRFRLGGERDGRDSAER